MEYSVVENGVVVNVVVANGPQDENWVEGNHSIGAVYDAKTGIFTRPAQPAPAVDRRAVILEQLAAIDAATDKARTRRELALGNADTKAWVQALDAQASALRAKLTA